MEQTEISLPENIFFKKLCDPSDKNAKVTAVELDKIKFSNGNEYPLRDGIPIFNNDAEWDNLYDHDENHYFSEDPFPANNYYLNLTNTNPGFVLDLGGGDGVFTAGIATKEYPSFCVDVSKTALKRLQRRNNPHLFPVCASGSKLPFPDNCFDSIVFIFVVEHLPPVIVDEFFKEMIRILKPGGKIIYTTDTPFFDKYLVLLTDLILRFKLTDRSMYSHHTGHINLLTQGQSRDLIQKYKELKIVKECPFEYGSRFGFVRLFHKIIKTLLPKTIHENYFTSKYTIIIEKQTAN